MKITDNQRHKIDADFNKSGFLIISASHKNDKGVWKTKKVGLSPNAQATLAEMIVNKWYKGKTNWYEVLDTKEENKL